LAEIDENAIVKGVAIVRGTAFVSGNAQVRNAAIVEGKASVSGNACIIEAGRVSGAGAVHRNAVVKGYSTIGTDACIQDAKDVYTVAAATPSSPCFTFYKTVYNGMGVYISRFEKNFFCQKDFTEWAKKRPDYKDKRLFYKNAVKKAKEEILGAA
jgi:hypothetical protein